MLAGKKGKRPTTNNEVDSHQDYLDAIFNAGQAYEDQEKRKKKRRNRKKAPIPNFAAAARATSENEEFHTTPVKSNPVKKKSKTLLPRNIDTFFVAYKLKTNFPGSLLQPELDTHFKQNREIAVQHKARGGSLIYSLWRPSHPTYEHKSIDLHDIAKACGYSGVKLCQADLYGYPDFLDTSKDDPRTYMIPASGQHFKPDDIITGRAEMFKRILTYKFHPQLDRENHLFLCAMYDPPLDPNEQEKRFKFHVSDAYGNGKATWNEVDLSFLSDGDESTKEESSDSKQLQLIKDEPSDDEQKPAAIPSQTKSDDSNNKGEFPMRWIRESKFLHLQTAFWRWCFVHSRCPHSWGREGGIT